MARLEIEIGGSDKGGNSELRETLGLLEQLKNIQSGLEVDLFKAETVDDIRSVGEQLTGVNIRIGEYLNMASKATDAWKDNKTSVILDNLATKVAVARANTAAFGESVKVQSAELRAYQTAFDQLIANGLDRTSTEVLALESNIGRLTNSIQNQKGQIADQKVFDTLSTKLKQIATDNQLVGNAEKTATASIKAYRAAIAGLISNGVDPADDSIKKLQGTLNGLNEELKDLSLARVTGSLQATGSIFNDLNARIAQIKTNLNFATSEESIASLNKELATSQEELRRLQRLGLTAEQQMKRFGSTSSAAGTEFARIVQDLPYAAQNFGSIGNNITRVTELWPQYIAGVRAAVVANGQAVTSANVFKGALTGLVSGGNAWILAISAIVSAYTAWQMWSQKQQRELEKEKKKVKELAEQVDEYIKTLDAYNKLAAETISNFSKEITTLETLYRTIQNNTVARKQQQSALEELQKLYPEIFSNLSLEEVQAGKTAKAYENLANNIRQVAYLEAARSLGAKATEDALKASVAQNAAYAKAQKAIEKYEEVRARSNRETGFLESNEAYEVAQKLVQESNKLGEAYKVASTEAEAYYKAAEQFGGIVREQSGLIYDLEKRIRQLQNVRPFLKTKEDIAANTKEANKLQAELEKLGGGSRIKIPSVTGITDESKKAVKITRELGDAIKSIFDIDTDAGNLIGLEGLEKANQQVQNKYAKLMDTLKEEERKQVQYYNDQQKRKALTATQTQERIAEITKQVAAERKEIEQGLERDLAANTAKYTEERINKIAELEGKAGISRIRNREQELAADALYWDGVARNAQRYNITAEQLTEFRKSSEAQINAKWDQKMIESSFIYRRRENESLSQMLIRRLNKETELELKAAQGNVQKKIELQKKYFEQLNAIQSRQSQVDFLVNTDFDVFSVKLADMTTQANLFAQALQNGVISPEQYAQTMAYWQMQQQQVQLLKSSVDSLTSSVGDGLTGVLFGAEDAMDNLGEAFKKVAQDIISGLIKIALRYAINQALGVTSMATTAAASSAAATTVAAAWATAAALVSAATFGANTAAAGPALAGLIASTKLLSGFYSGGYTGNVGRKQVAGVVHGQEFVVNAKATQENMPLLRAMNAGRDITSALPKSTRSVSYGSLNTERSAEQQVRITGSLSNTEIKLSNDRASRFNRKFGRS